MKKGIAVLTALSLAASTAFSLPQTNESHCWNAATVVQWETLRIDQIRHDLANGMWIDGQAQEPAVVFAFDDQGAATMMARNYAGRYLTRHFDWKVETIYSTPVLVLRNADGKTLFRIQPTCQGLELSNLETGERWSLDYVPVANTAETRRWLIGEWANAAYSYEDVDLPGGQGPLFLHYRFNADGTYHKSLGSGDALVEEAGQWEVSRDGHFLLLHARSSAGDIQTQMVPILHFDLDELVLDQSLQLNGEDYCARRRNLFFNKI